MKKLLIFLTLWVAFKGNICTQPYESIFGQQSTYWIIEWSNLFGTTADTFFITQDTLINGLTYKKVKGEGAGFSSGGLLREDIFTGKIWYRDLGIVPIQDTSDLLLIDMELSKGDTFYMRTWGDSYNNYPNWYNIVDSVLIQNGKKVVRFLPNNNYAGTDSYGFPVSFIEGVGTNLSLVYLNAQGIIAPYLLCAYKDGVRTFVNGYYKTCDRTFSGIEAEGVNHPSFHIQPNPVENNLVLSLVAGAEAESIDWEIVDVRGISQLNGLDIILKDKEIDISMLPIGVYILVIRTPFRFETHRIIKL